MSFSNYAIERPAQIYWHQQSYDSLEVQCCKALDSPKTGLSLPPVLSCILEFLEQFFFGQTINSHERDKEIIIIYNSCLKITFTQDRLGPLLAIPCFVFVIILSRNSLSFLSQSFDRLPISLSHYHLLSSQNSLQESPSVAHWVFYGLSNKDLE